MASTNKTANLELPQWERTDSVEMEDMNAAFEKIDAGIIETRDTRLRAELLLDLNVPASNLNVMSVDLSEIDFAAYKFVLIFFPQLVTSSVRFNQNDSAADHLTDGCYMFGFPMFTEGSRASFIVVYSAELKTATATVGFSGLKSFYITTFGDLKFNTATKIKIWGVK